MPRLPCFLQRTNSLHDQPFFRELISSVWVSYEVGVILGGGKDKDKVVPVLN
jgi:hypothetical protein